ncbi:type II toxin-antitoxin system VapC family toxin, partial [Actinophytocola sp.]|uniref:type II toxin-antitoxin system VapC family toxin n=1 Tax=Actinophytocola sp. TaxID=1872138 RepID=UPI002D806B78
RVLGVHLRIPPRRSGLTSVSSIVLDTDVASHVLRDRLAPPLATKLIGRTPIITFVTLAELTTWVELRHWGPSRLASFARWLDGVGVLHSTDGIARMWGRIMAGAVACGRPRPQNDTWIAACCLANGLPLATLNAKDFDYFAEHERLSLIST